MEQAANGKDPSENSLVLLTECLTAAQREQYAKHRYFEVIGGESGKRYRIWCGDTFNVEELDQNGTPVFKLCFVPAGSLLLEDVMLAQKIALELFESAARKVAREYPAAASGDPNEEPAPRRAVNSGQSPPPPTPPANASRYARLGDRLVTADFGFLEGGFTTADPLHESVCVMNGAELEFEHGIEYHRHGGLLQSMQKVVAVGLIPVDYPEVAPVLRMENGDQVPFHRLSPGQRVTVVFAPDPNRAYAEITRLIMRR